MTSTSTNSIDPTSLSLTSLIHLISKSISSDSSPEDATHTSNPIDLVSLAIKRSNQLNLISTNDSLKEINTSALRSLFLNSFGGMAWNNKLNSKDDHKSGYSQRKINLVQSQVQFKEFLSTISNLSILSPSLKSLIQSQSGPISTSTSSNDDSSPSSSSIPKMDKRSLKITLFKTERSLTSELENFRKSYREKYEKRKRVKIQDPIEEVLFDLLILKDGNQESTSSSSSDDEEEEEDDDDEDENEGSSSTSSSPRSLRSYLLLLLNLHSLKASSSLESISQELSLLNSMPSPSEMELRRNNELDEREKARNRFGGGEGDEWRLTRSVGEEGGALMDKDGKPLRPFTITSGNGNSKVGASGSGQGPKAEVSKREQLRNQVFQNGARLPTMSIDEYLEEEQRRGNILTGGGPEGAAKATPREARAIRAENDGTREGYEAEEEARKEAIEWDNFTEENRKGEGNTMNRG